MVVESHQLFAQDQQIESSPRLHQDMSRPNIRLHTVDIVEKITQHAVRPLIVAPYSSRRYSAEPRSLHVP
jgi:hypothetical protein